MESYQESGQQAPPPAGGSCEIPITDLISLEKKFNNGASWFYWIAGLSVLSALLIFVNSPYISAITLGSTEFLAALGREAPALAYVSIAAGVLIVGVFALLGYLSSKRHTWAYILGIVLFSLDTLLLLWVQDFFGLAFHAYVLYNLITGLVALGKLKRLLPH